MTITCSYISFITFIIYQFFRGPTAIYFTGFLYMMDYVLLLNGIRVYIYPGMSHLKAAVYDGWACLGSANLDQLDLRIFNGTMSPV